MPIDMKKAIFYLLFSFILVFLFSCNSSTKMLSGSRADSIMIENIFPYQTQHCHASTIVELPNSDLLAAWFQGSGERTAEDVVIKGSRFSRKTGKWSEPFIMADAPGFADINPVLFIDNKSRLWLVWYTVIAYQWESSLLKYRISTDYLKSDGAPLWDWQDVLIVKADGSTPDGIGKNDSFVLNLRKKYDDYYKSLVATGQIEPEGQGKITQEMWDRALERYFDIAKGTSFMRDGIDLNEKGERIRTRVGYPLMRRIGWQTKNKPLQYGNKILLPLYSDGFDFSLIAISDDSGESWTFSEPIVGAGCIQAALAFCNDSTIVAYMRDNGPPPQRLMQSRSKDFGRSWSIVEDTEIANPGSGADMVKLKSGNWALVSNDLENGRYRLTVMLSTDEGKTWKYSKQIVNGLPGSQTRAHYPAIIQDSQGLIHVSFTNQVPTDDGKSNVKNIAHAVFTEKWLLE
jgi:predicted neuraminidase